MDIRISVTPARERPEAEAFGVSLSLSGFDKDKALVISEADGEIMIRFVGAPDEGGTPVLEGSLEEATEAPAATEAPPDTEAAPAPEPDSERELFQKLTLLRKKIAVDQGVPPYVIFHDNTLREMARTLPADLEALNAIQGVGKAKLDKYGALFIAAIKERAEA